MHCGSGRIYRGPCCGDRVAYVFDIAQVDAIAGTDAAAVTATTTDTGAHRHLEAVKAFLAAFTKGVKDVIADPKTCPRPEDSAGGS